MIAGGMLLCAVPLPAVAVARVPTVGVIVSEIASVPFVACNVPFVIDPVIAGSEVGLFLL